MRDSRPTEPDESSGIPEECPVCKRDNADDEGELLLPSGHCTEVCAGHSEHGSYSWRGVDNADGYIGDEADGVYYSVGQGPDGWYLTTVVDCDSAGFVDTMTSDDGPYKSEAEAICGGKDAGIEWCMFNEVAIDWEELAPSSSI